MKGLSIFNNDEVREVLSNINSLSGAAAKQALLGVGESFRYVASLKNGYFKSIIDDAVLLTKSEIEKKV